MGPKLLTSPCTIRIPRFMMDCCTQVSVEKETISWIRPRRRERKFHIERTCGKRISV